MALALAAANPPAALTEVSGGMWEVSGIPNQQPLRACFADSMLLAQVEHRGKKCAATVIKDSETKTVIEYRCPGGGFGRSNITIITPRSLRIETQGISDNFPFGYVAQAHRIGDCAGGQASNPTH